MSSEEKCEKLAGHPPAVKAGGMRITQHKTPHAKDPKEPANEDLTGLGGPNPLQSSAAVNIAGAPNKGNADFTPEAAQVAHSPKPPTHIHNVPRPNIQQPRK
ncbi:death-associated protein domain-containing protein [Phthorimaea operculella]|nr:death-associated protein domain-containing protein [Phthorimaea operculella]